MNKEIAQKEASGKYGTAQFANVNTNQPKIKGPQGMAQALEAIVKQSGNGADPNFSRGAELEITTMQDVEMLKAHLAMMKVHIPTVSLERGIIMPRDLETGGMNYPKPQDLLIVNPYKTEKKKAVTRRKK